MDAGTNPCCCCTVQTGTKIVAIVNIVFSALNMIFSLLAVILILVESSSGTDITLTLSREGFQVSASLTGSILSIIVSVGYLVISVLLLQGAKQRNYGKCKLWLVASLVILILFVIRSLLSSVAFANFLGLLIGVAIMGWQLWTVYVFMKEIQSEATNTTAAGEAAYVAAQENEDA